jgi:hypothetical protein
LSNARRIPGRQTAPPGGETASASRLQRLFGVELGPTGFLTKSRGSLQEFESQVVRLLKTVTAPKEEDQHAA